MNEQIRNIDDWASTIVPEACPEPAQGDRDAAPVGVNVDKTDKRTLTTTEFALLERLAPELVSRARTGGGGRGPSNSEIQFGICCGLVDAGVDDQLHYRILRDRTHFPWLVSAIENQHGQPRTSRGPDDYAVRQIERAREAALQRAGSQASLAGEAADGRLILSKKNWDANAEKFVGLECLNLKHFRGDWYDWGPGFYRSIEPATFRAKVRGFLGRAKVVVTLENGTTIQLPFQPTIANVNEMVQAIEAAAHRDCREFQPPCWTGKPGPDPRECIMFRNGILHVPTRAFIPATEAPFNFTALDIPYDPDAPQPELWLKKLGEWFPAQDDGSAKIALLQEMAGYLVGNFTVLQKILLVYGPPRSGKGTIAGVLQALIGKENYASPTISGLGERFGLECLLNKKAAFISDMSLGRNANVEEIVGNLKRISGADSVSVERKHRGAVEVQLNLPFTIFGNEMPGLADASSALASRLVVLPMTQSFLGNEDPSLASKLHCELPGIFNWSLLGWDRLRANGRFGEVEGGKEAKVALARAGSPIRSFVEDVCILDPLGHVSKADAYAAWERWCKADGRLPGSKERFCLALYGAYPGKVKASKHRDGGRPVHSLDGIRLLDPEVEDQVPF
jgi:P4 family phage/plasmid primase-like protien